jgi:uncharacterized cupredoxin-like copper-binding protein
MKRRLLFALLVVAVLLLALGGWAVGAGRDHHIAVWQPIKGARSDEAIRNHSSGARSRASGGNRARPARDAWEEERLP